MNYQLLWKFSAVYRNYITQILIPVLTQYSLKPYLFDSVLSCSKFHIAIDMIKSSWSRYLDLQTKLNCGIKVCWILHPNCLCYFLWTGQNGTRTVSVNQSTSGLKSFQLTFLKTKSGLKYSITVTLLRSETPILWMTARPALQFRVSQLWQRLDNFGNYVYMFFRNSNKSPASHEICSYLTIIGIRFSHDSDNYQGQSLSYLPKPKAEADNTNWGLENVRYHAKTESNNCFIMPISELYL